LLWKLIRFCPIVLTGAWLLGSQPAAADWDYRVGVLSAWHEVSERDGSEKLVEEDGLLTGLVGALSHTTGVWRYGVDAKALRASLDYDGATQFGAPLETNTDWQHWRIGTFVDRRVPAPLPTHIGVGLEYEWRDREIESTPAAPGLEETYRTVWIGARATFAPMKSTTFELHVACAIDSTVDVAFASNLDRATLEAEDHCRASVASTMSVGRIGTARLFLRPFANWERYPRTKPEQLTSGGIEVGQVYLPETEFISLGITIGLHGQRD